MEPHIRRCIVCGISKDVVEFFREYVCIDCFMIADKFGRSRKVMDECNKKEMGIDDESDRNS